MDLAFGLFQASKQTVPFKKLTFTFRFFMWLPQLLQMVDLAFGHQDKHLPSKSTPHSNLHIHGGSVALSTCSRAQAWTWE